MEQVLILGGSECVDEFEFSNVCAAAHLQAHVGAISIHRDNTDCRPRGNER